MPRLKIIVSGRVQGVCYRAFTAEQAGQLGINGTVRNLPDGSVEIMAEAQQEALHRLIACCRQGPPAARVEHVETIALPEAGAAFAGFTVLR